MGIKASNKRVMVKCHDCGTEYDVAESTFKQRKYVPNHVWRCKVCAEKQKQKVLTENKNKPKVLVDVKCGDCGKIYQVAESTYKDRGGNAHWWRCRSCAIKLGKINAIINRDSKEKAIVKCRDCGADIEILKDTQIKNGSNHEYICKSCISNIGKEKFKNLSDEEKEKYINNLREKSTERMNKLSDEERKAIGERLHRDFDKWYNNLSDKEKQQYKDKLNTGKRRFWDAQTDEYKKKRIAPAREGYEKWWNNLTEEERKEFHHFIQDGHDRYFDNLTREKFINHSLKMVLGIERNAEKQKLTSTETAFKELLEEYNISYSMFYPNKEKHEKFDELFPINPITGSDRVSPYHSWDFKIETPSRSILIDVDGSMHDPTKTDYITLYNNRQVNLAKVHEFYDMQRPYKTDGLDAYIIKCYDDKFTATSEIFNIKTGESQMILSFIQKIYYDWLKDNQQKCDSKNKLNTGSSLM